MTQRRTIDVTGLDPLDVYVLEAIVLRLRNHIPLRILDASLTRHTDGTECWCNPVVEHYEHGDVIIHRDNEEAH